MRLKKIIALFACLFLASFEFIAFLANSLPITPLILAILLLILGVALYFRPKKPLYIALGVVTILSILYLIFPFKVELVEKGDPYYDTYFDSDTSKMSFNTISYGLINPKDIALMHTLPGGCIITPFMPKYSILIRNK